MAPKIWISDAGDAEAMASIARRREAQGFDGILVGDSQSRYADSFVTMTLIAQATSRLGIGTGVTNPVTRHPAVMAGGLVSLQQLSAGRVRVGIGRGDSALAWLGAAPCPPAAFERYLVALQGYLRGTGVDIDSPTFTFDGERLRPADALGLGHRPATGHLAWLDPALPKVPVDVFATGPRMLRLGAVVGDAVTVTVGADPVRVRWALDLARQACVEADLDPDALDIGLQLTVGLHDDVEVARRMAAGTTATMARFAVLHGTPTGPAPEGDAAALQSVVAVYDMGRHSTDGSPQSQALPDDFIDRYAVVGPPGAVVDRLLELGSLGVERLHLIFKGAGVPAAEVERSIGRFADEVLSAVG